MSDDTATTAQGWDSAYPDGTTDKRVADDQFRMLKATLLKLLKWTVVDNTDSPVTATPYTAYAFDLSSGSVVFNLPSVGATDDGCAIPIKVDSNANFGTIVTINRADSDTVRGETSMIIDTASYEGTLVYDHGNTNWMA